MLCEIKKYPVQHPLLRNYIKFFWEIHADRIHLNNKIIPTRNINIKFNLGDTPHYHCLDGTEHLLEDVYFSGLQDHFRNASIKLDGRVDMLGVCFLPDGFYPFIQIPVSEFKNQMLGAAEAGFNHFCNLNERLKEAPDVSSRLNILENELLLQVINYSRTADNFSKLFGALQHAGNEIRISGFCRRNDICIRKLERMYNKYVGVSLKAFCTLNRFQNSVNQVIYADYSKLSDVAYGNGYFDQMHFIREFKRFTGYTPGDFTRRNDSMLHVGKLT